MATVPAANTVRREYVRHGGRTLPFSAEYVRHGGRTLLFHGRSVASSPRGRRRVATAPAANTVRREYVRHGGRTLPFSADYVRHGGRTLLFRGRSVASSPRGRRRVATAPAANTVRREYVRHGGRTLPFSANYVRHGGRTLLFRGRCVASSPRGRRRMATAPAANAVRRDYVRHGGRTLPFSADYVRHGGRTLLLPRQTQSADCVTHPALHSVRKYVWPMFHSWLL